jgi:hypothetical protein
MPQRSLDGPGPAVQSQHEHCTAGAELAGPACKRRSSGIQRPPRKRLRQFNASQLDANPISSGAAPFSFHLRFMVWASSCGHFRDGDELLDYVCSG